MCNQLIPCNLSWLEWVSVFCIHNIPDQKTTLSKHEIMLLEGEGAAAATLGPWRLSWIVGFSSAPTVHL